MDRGPPRAAPTPRSLTPPTTRAVSAVAAQRLDIPDLNSGTWTDRPGFCKALDQHYGGDLTAVDALSLSGEGVWSESGLSD